MAFSSVFIIVILVVILAVDWVFLPKQVRRGYWLMALAFACICGVALFPVALTRLAELVGIGRGVDLVMYVALIVLIREYFLSRARQSALESQLTDLVRQLAVSRPVGYLEKSETPWKG